MNPLDSIPGTIGCRIRADRRSVFCGEDACLDLLERFPLTCNQPKEDIQWKPYWHGDIIWRVSPWIGILYYFNFIQVPFLGKVTPETKAEAFTHLVPNALWWFRWGALGHLGVRCRAPDEPGPGPVRFGVRPAGTGCRHRDGGLARDHYALQRLGHHLAQPEKGAGPQRSLGG